MAWYQGKQSVAFDGSNCLFWTEKSWNGKNSTGFPTKSSLVGLEAHENYCRNPDNDFNGPWCFTAGNKTVVKKPCFLPCVETSSKDFCLSKKGFPYNDRNSVDLSDINSAPGVIDVIKGAQPTTLPRRFVFEKSLHRGDHKTCNQWGEQAEYFGPWISVMDNVAKKSIRKSGRSSFLTICRDHKLGEGNHLYFDDESADSCSFWRQCYTACQDDHLMLAKSHQFFVILGAKIRIFDSKECLPWSEAMAHIFSLSAIIDWGSAFLTQNEQLRRAQMQLRPDDKIARAVFYFVHLFAQKDDSNNFTNHFVDSRLFLNTGNRCTDLKPLLNLNSSIEERFKAFEFTNYSMESEENWKRMLHEMVRGPGCFTFDKSQKIQYKPCFQGCNASFPDPIEPFMKLCDSNGKTGVCSEIKETGDFHRGREEAGKSNILDFGREISLFLVLLALFVINLAILLALKAML
ncbi:unnamed protein product [Caenorhabditis auriculariae]|uniref:Kringle domain-containing protein n=1 Tax=Caenorhabditis auriculariae TaxID=2777116 RepID=A0A8S1HM25_9PELO|nr:unnamed protein product [Caenorhabditis auriculariae]